MAKKIVVESCINCPFCSHNEARKMDKRVALLELEVNRHKEDKSLMMQDISDKNKRLNKQAEEIEDHNKNHLWLKHEFDTKDKVIKELKSEFEGYKEGIELAAKLTANQIKEQQMEIDALRKGRETLASSIANYERGKNDALDRLQSLKVMKDLGWEIKESNETEGKEKVE